MALTNPQETVDERPTCVTYAAGRIFYGMKNSVYFSQVMEGESVDFLNRCYQQNDPTSEQISDLLDTDGGVIQINEAININQLEALGNGVVVYAQNGVWYISGPETGFTATSHFRTSIIEAGCISPQSVIRVEDTHYFWSKEGIFQVFINQFGQVQAKNIIEGTLQTYYNDILLASKKKVTGNYNRVKKQIEWFYATANQTGATDYKFAHDKSLLLDLRSGGIWPQEYNSTLSEAAGNFIVGGVDTNQGTADAENALLTITLGTPSSTQTYSVDFGFKTDTTFKDFSSTYPTAYLETGYEALDKPSNSKKAPYVITHFLQTEANWIDDGSGGLTFDLPSSCNLQSKWDWNNSAANNRWGPQQEVYRFRRVFTPPAASGSFDSGEQVITTKNKVRGQGKALSLRFEQTANKDMKLLGWTVQWTIKGRM